MYKIQSCLFGLSWKRINMTLDAFKPIENLIQTNGMNHEIAGFEGKQCGNEEARSLTDEKTRWVFDFRY